MHTERNDKAMGIKFNSRLYTLQRLKKCCLN
nr:MAG TPA: hypothetical protein [Caudoviricetes sp.]